MMEIKNKIGPHSLEILSIIYGTLLGNSNMEKRFNNVRISFKQENKNVEYLYWLWKTLSQLGYCTNNKPKLKERISKNGKKIFYYKFNSYTYSNLNYIYDEFYRNNSKIKRVPDNIFNNLTPLALACWIMEDGIRIGKGIKLSTEVFLKEDVELLIKILFLKWDIKSSIQKSGKAELNQWVIYISKSEVYKVQNLVFPFIVKSMLYKIHK